MKKGDFFARAIKSPDESRAQMFQALERVLDSPGEPDKWSFEIRQALMAVDGFERFETVHELYAQRSKQRLVQLASEDLLAACKGLVEALDGRVHSTPALQALVAAAQAIKKAEGTQSGMAPIAEKGVRP